VIRALALVAVSAPALAQPRIEWGGEIALGFRELWEGQSTGDGFDAHQAPAVTAQLGSMRWSGVIATLGLDWTTFGVSGGEGNVAVRSRHHLVGAGPHVAWLDPEWRAGVLLEALVERVSTTIELGSSSERAAGVHGGFRYGVESCARLGAAPATFGLQIGGERRDDKDDFFLTFAFGWVWGAMAPEIPDPEAPEREEEDAGTTR
jgi:hypothetical protein